MAYVKCFEHILEGSVDFRGRGQPAHRDTGGQTAEDPAARADASAGAPPPNHAVGTDHHSEEQGAADISGAR